MDSNETPARRRRGAALESALLDAAWDELDEHGYAALTMEAVATRAGTSRPVLARRWATRSDLALAAIRHHFAAEPIQVSDHGSLRKDTLDLLRQMNTRRRGLVTEVLLRFSGIVSESDGGIAGFRERLIGDQPTQLRLILERADARGEIDLARLSPVVADLPLTLLRHEMLMRPTPADDETLQSFVDDVFLPLARATRSNGGGEQ
ncbi:TetR/AcrR family transcriptional regulator [Leifsonia sp. 21MFCrub1.1]|uniref:TetR/AcrR family transcriptional regulator n=1 Tax=Leifsonia sp. 21MFCrub1.1 TaxID=1798223 RepID=UPI0008929372|nr:TetR/AcrR family transcriptional regulator [Leifsonia sp. 21MFCrub1.1]SEA74270.1 DNA-binding transcriptional regulator, AcrR family [Leifsonia sp. 21MFCrub1.1]